jgi:hypothetical protein
LLGRGDRELELFGAVPQEGRFQRLDRLVASDLGAADRTLDLDLEGLLVDRDRPARGVAVDVRGDVVDPAFEGRLVVGLEQGQVQLRPRRLPRRSRRSPTSEPLRPRSTAAATVASTSTA